MEAFQVDKGEKDIPTRRNIRRQIPGAGKSWLMQEKGQKSTVTSETEHSEWYFGVEET